MKIKSINISIFGGNIKRNGEISSTYFQEAVIHFSAPIVNLLIGLFMCVFLRIKNTFSVANVILGVFNLIPFYSFDGGAGFRCVLLNFLPQKLTETIITIISVIVTSTITFLSFWVIVKTKNFNLALFSVYMILCLLFKK